MQSHFMEQEILLFNFQYFGRYSKQFSFGRKYMYIIAKNPKHTRYTTIPVASCVYKQDPDAACLLFTACRLCYHVTRTAQPYLHPQCIAE